MSPDDVDLHDAVLETIKFDVPAKRIEIHLQFYRDQIEDRDRIPIRLIFQNVKHFSLIGNMPELGRNAGFGNVNYWRWRKQETAVYLFDGCILITSKTREIFIGDAHSSL